MSLKFEEVLGAAALALALCLSSGASATDLKACRDGYRAADAAGRLHGLGWDAYRAKVCGDPGKAVVRRSLPAGVGFPGAVDRKYSRESPDKARLHTCMDAFRRNQANRTLGDLKWTSQSGGYLEYCNRRLGG